ncbi:MAG: hypothetical protein IPO56_16950 [Flavobacteriales bacterium]|nr:hypothetical protein [Flavobacteriales bacterium]
MPATEATYRRDLNGTIRTHHDLVSTTSSDDIDCDIGGPAGAATEQRDCGQRLRGPFNVQWVSNDTVSGMGRHHPSPRTCNPINTSTTEDVLVRVG